MRRSNGTGTVVKLPGNRRRPYAVKVPYRNERGRVRQKYLSYHAKAAEAQAALDAWNSQCLSGTAPKTDTLSVTVGEIYKRWSEREYRSLGPPSVVSYTSAWNKRISRYSARCFREVTLDDWQAILDEDEDNGLSQSTVSNDAHLIRSLCKFAMSRDVITKNPADFLEVPSVDVKNPRNSLNDIQLAKLKQLATDGFPLADTALMLCYTGFRIKAFLSLTRFNYDPVEHTLRGGSKSDAGKDRVVPVHPLIQPYLDAWLAKGGQTIVCQDSGLPYTATTYRNHFKLIADAIGLPEATPHWCRHTFATNLYKANVDKLLRKRLLGHARSGDDVTDRYTHTDVFLLREAVEKLA